MNLDSLKTAATGRWPEILSIVAGIPLKHLDGKHHPCPKCDGKDRFRLIDRDAGAVFCNQCFDRDNGDGIAAVQWMTGCDFKTACDKLAAYLKLDSTSQSPQIVATFAYRDESGKLLFYIDRREPGDKGKPKDFVARSPSGRGAKGIRRVLYRLPELLNSDAGEPVFIPEGEKHCDALAALGLIAVCNPFGAGGWKDDYSQSLAGRHVVILPDNDDAGRDHGKQVAESLAGIAASVKRLYLPNLRPKGDVLDWLAAGGTKDELLKLAVAVTPEAGEVNEWMLGPRTMRERLKKHKGLKPAVLNGLLREGETMNVIAPTKVRKSWLSYSLALSIVTGKKWLDRFSPVPGKVLLVDFELHEETFDQRILDVTEALGIALDEYGEQFEAWTLRGLGITINDLAKRLEAYRPGTFKCVVIDALYRTLPPEISENANAEMTRVYNTIDQMAMRSGAAIVLVHHTSKGNQSEKSVTDVGSGAGAIARAADTHVVLREHEEPGVVVMETALRSWPPIDPICLRWSWPFWQPEDGLDPADLKQPGRRQRKASREASERVPKDPWTARRFVESFVTGHPRHRAAIIDDACEAGLTQTQAEKLLKRAMAKELAFEHPGKWLASVPAPATEATTGNNWPATDNKAVVTEKQTEIWAALAEKPDASNREIAEKCGVSKEYVRQLRTDPAYAAAL